MPITYFDPWDVFEQESSISYVDYDPQLGALRRQYPRWHKAYSSSNSLIANLVTSIITATNDIEVDTTRLINEKLLLDSSVGSYRYQWKIPRLADNLLGYRISIDLGDGEEEVVTATKYTSKRYGKPSFVLEDDNILLTNLLYKEVTVYSTSGNFTILNEVSGIIPDLDLWWQGASGNPWQKVEIKNSFSGNIVTLPVSGKVTLRYGSIDRNSALASSIVYIRDTYGNTITSNLTEDFAFNALDEVGVLADCVRLDNTENNDSYRDRLIKCLAITPTLNKHGLSLAIAIRLGLIESVLWDGNSELILDADDVFNINSFIFPNVRSFITVRDRLLPIVSGSTDKYVSQYNSWDDYYQIFIDGVPIDGVTVSGNIVTLPTATTGIVTANYSLSTYVINYHNSGNLRSIASGSFPLKHPYTIYYSKYLDIITLYEQSTVDELLLDANGLPTKLFQEVRSIFQNTSKIVAGKTNWNDAGWLVSLNDLEFTLVNIPFDS